MDIPEIVQFAAALLFVLALIILVAWVLRRYFGGGARTGSSPLRRRDRRLGIVEAAQIGNRHRLVLVRRDDREHLLLLGGSNELLVEANITTRTETAEVNIRATEPSFANPAPAGMGGLTASTPEPAFDRSEFERPAPEPYSAPNFTERNNDEIAFSSQDLSSYKDTGPSAETGAGSAYLSGNTTSFLDRENTDYAPASQPGFANPEPYPPAENNTTDSTAPEGQRGEGQSRILSRFLNKPTD